MKIIKVKQRTLSQYELERKKTPAQQKVTTKTLSRKVGNLWYEIWQVKI